MRALCITLLFVAACDRPETEARALAEPRRARFAEFDGWARRTLASDPAVRDRARLEDTLFAPLLLDSQVDAAWVERRTPEARFAHGEDFDALRAHDLHPLRFGETRLEASFDEAHVWLARDEGGVRVTLRFQRATE